jgi:hypothetical protein
MGKPVKKRELYAPFAPGVRSVTENPDPRQIVAVRRLCPAADIMAGMTVMVCEKDGIAGELDCRIRGDKGDLL